MIGRPEASSGRWISYGTSRVTVAYRMLNLCVSLSAHTVLGEAHWTQQRRSGQLKRATYAQWSSQHMPSMTPQISFLLSSAISRAFSLRLKRGSSTAFRMTKSPLTHIEKCFGCEVYMAHGLSIWLCDCNVYQLCPRATVLSCPTTFQGYKSTTTAILDG